MCRTTAPTDRTVAPAEGTPPESRDTVEAGADAPPRTSPAAESTATDPRRTHTADRELTARVARMLRATGLLDSGADVDAELMFEAVASGDADADPGDRDADTTAGDTAPGGRTPAPADRTAPLTRLPPHPPTR